jgi:hypothetical protein
MMDNADLKTLCITNRRDWRAWLEKHFDTEPKVWLVFPKKALGKPRISYNDAVQKRPEEFKKRLRNFIKKTKENKQIEFGGIEKYYWFLKKWSSLFF